MLQHAMAIARQRYTKICIAHGIRPCMLHSPPPVVRASATSTDVCVKTNTTEILVNTDDHPSTVNVRPIATGLALKRLPLPPSTSATSTLPSAYRHCNIPEATRQYIRPLRPVSSCCVPAETIPRHRPLFTLLGEMKARNFPPTRGRAKSGPATEVASVLLLLCHDYGQRI